MKIAGFSKRINDDYSTTKLIRFDDGTYIEHTGETDLNAGDELELFLGGFNVLQKSETKEKCLCQLLFSEKEDILPFWRKNSPLVLLQQFVVDNNKNEPILNDTDIFNIESIYFDNRSSSTDSCYWLYVCINNGYKLKLRSKVPLLNKYIDKSLCLWSEPADGRYKIAFPGCAASDESVLDTYYISMPNICCDRVYIYPEKQEVPQTPLVPVVTQLSYADKLKEKADKYIEDSFTKLLSDIEKSCDAYANAGKYECEITFERTYSRSHMTKLEEWMKERGLKYSFTSKGFRIRWDDAFPENAAKDGNLDVLKCEQAAKDGNLDLLKYLRSQGKEWDELTCSNAAMNGHLEVLKWARENGCPWDERTSNVAAYTGNLEVLKYAKEHGCPWCHMVYYYAMERNYLHILTYAKENACPITSVSILDDIRKKYPELGF